MGERDLTMMIAAHEAFRRDLRRLVAQPSLERWRRFSEQLSLHHKAEDAVLWPRMRRRGVDRGLLDAMEGEHGLIDPLLGKVAAAFAARDSAGQGKHLKVLADLLDRHLGHEERDLLPLINDQEWSALEREFRRRVGVGGIRKYFSWLLEDAPAELRDRVRQAVPRPVRLLIRA